jgi:amino acid adenylation domain-containing protein
MDAYYQLLSRHRELDKDAFVEPGKGRLSYRDLFDQADQLGGLLQGRLGGDNEAVGIFKRKSLSAVLAIFGVLAADKAFVPIDPKLPLERIRFILEQTGIRLVLVDEELDEASRTLFAEMNVLALSVDVVDGKMQHALAQPHWDDRAPVALSQAPLSHVLFTSGTTGVPKGVMIRRDSQIAFTRCMGDAFGHDLQTRWLSVSPLYFDVCTLDLFVEAYCGATVFLLPPNQPAPAVAKALEKHGITHTLLISSVIKMLASSQAGLERCDLSSLRALWYGGEACPIDALRRIKAIVPHITFAQCYGPSEVCNNATLFRFDDVPPSWEGYMPLGGPIDTVEAYLLDGDGRLIDGEGVGELYLGGIQVMAGYVSDTQATADALVPNNWNPASPHPWLYRTGDYLRRDADGLLHFHGRRDDLVKIRGNRVSLHEVQAAVNAMPGVLDTVLFVGKDDIGGTLDSLNAIVITSTPMDQASLRSGLRQRLPGYMVPDRFFIEEKTGVPMKENGKLDKAQLIRRYQHPNAAAAA